MAQHDHVLDNDTGAAFRADLNNALLAIVSQNSGATEPATTYAYQWWADTTTGLLKIRNAANSAWVTVGTLASTNLGLLSLAGGIMTGVLQLVAGGSAATPDAAFSGDTNTGIYRAGADLLGLVGGGTELLRVDGILGYVKLLSTAGVLLPSGTSAQRPAGANGILRFNSDTSSFEGYKGGAWGAIGGGGGGGGGITWQEISGTAPTPKEEYGIRSYSFGGQQTVVQDLYTTVVVPQSYVAGTQIFLYVSAYSPSSSNTQLFKAVATLIRPGTTAFDATTNQRTTTNAALTNTVAKQARTHTLDITDSSGQINGVAVAAGDIIKVQVYRDNTDTDTADVQMIPVCSDVKFS